MNDTELTLADFQVGQRVSISPSHWLFLAGAHFGEVVKVGTKKVHVRATINQVVYTVLPRSLTIR